MFKTLKTMKRTNNIKLILLIILGVSILATVLIKVLEYYFGAANVFIGAVVLIPVCFVWVAIVQNKNSKT